MMWHEGIEYEKGGLKYRVLSSQYCLSNIKGFRFESDLCCIYGDGTLVVKRGFEWNGATGVTDEVMRAECFHDMLYGFIEQGILPNTWAMRRKCDKLFYKLNRSGGMSWTRANIRYYGVRGFGGLFC